MKKSFTLNSVVLLLGLIWQQGAFAQVPGLVWAKRIGSTSSDIGQSIALDGSGNVYTTGRFDGTVDFDPGAGVFNLTSVGLDIFVSKLDASGNFVWAKNMSSTGHDIGFSIALDGSGKVYTTGSFQGTVDFDPDTAISYTLTSAGGDDIFVSKLDASGNVYTIGYFQNTADFDPGAGTFNLVSAGIADIFVSKLDASGNFIWAKHMGGTIYDVGLSIALDGAGNVYTTGYFEGTADFDPGAGVFNLVSAGNYEIFVSKLDASGNFVWAKRMGGTSADYGTSIALDGSDNVYTTGSFQGTVDFDPGAGVFNLVSAGNYEIFVSKLDASGIFQWAKSMGGTIIDFPYSIALDGSGNIYTTGYFQGTADFDPGTGTFTLTSAGAEDIFVSELDASGNFICAGGMGGTSDDVGYSIALDGSGNIYTTGFLNGSVDFDPGPGVSNLVSAGGYDIFVTKYTDCSQTTGIPVISGTADYFKIYPNPANSLINIEASAKTPFEISMMNVYGEIILNQQTVGSQYAIDVSKFESGIYFIQVVSKGKFYNHKIIITHQ